MTKPGARAKLTRLMKADTISKKRKESGDVRTDKEVRKATLPIERQLMLPDNS